MQSLVIFDLDDTLIDTSGVLLPAALQRVVDATGIPLERLNARGKTLGELLAGAADIDPDVREAAKEAWYRPEVPPLVPLPGARELLGELRGKVRLFLLTRGNPPRQEEKIRQSGLGPYFEGTVIRPFDSGGSKRDDIQALLERCGLPPDRCAVVGDDVTDELKHAKELGCLAIEVPATPLSGVLSELRRAGLCTA